MSKFFQNLRSAFRGDHSFESAEAAPEVNPAAEPAITDDLIIEVQEERQELSDCLDEVEEQSEDQRDLESAVAMAKAVTDAVEAVETMPAHASEAFVEIANVTIANAEDVLEVDIPRLDTGSDGTVTEASMESFLGWFKDAAKSFGAAASSFMERMAISFSRLNDTSKGLTKRSMRVRSVIGKRKGNGGKPLKLSSGVLKHLIVGDGYTADPIGELTKFSGTNFALTKVVETYHSRLAEIIKNRIFDAMANKTNNNILISVPTDDLLKQLRTVIDAQPDNFMGNQVYAIQENRYNVILQAVLAGTATDAATLVKHLDAPMSLTNEEVGVLLTGVEGLITEQLKALERITSATSSTFQSVRGVISSLNKAADKDEDSDVPVNANHLDLLRIENDMVAELGRVCERLNSYQSDLIDRLDSVLTLIEESVFQD